MSARACGVVLERRLRDTHVAARYVFRGLQPEEPVTSSGYLNRFTNLQITCILMDEVMLSPEEPSKDFIVEFETKALRDARDLLANPV